MRYRKSINLGGGTRINLSKSGIGLSAGVKGARYSVNTSGRRTTSVGLPGTGISYRTQSGGSYGSSRRATSGALTPYQLQKRHERHQRKLQLALERRAKPLEKLKELYAAGKVNKSEYEELAKRDAAVELDLVILGKAPALKVAERYVTGKISDADFEDMKNEIMGDSVKEKEAIAEGFLAVQNRANEFTQHARSNNRVGICANCSKKKGIFSPLHQVFDFMLCGKCQKEYTAVCSYGGVSGSYYESASAILTPNVKNSLQLNIQSERVLEYR